MHTCFDGVIWVVMMNTVEYVCVSRGTRERVKENRRALVVLTWMGRGGETAPF
jgi:hypothetical protein